MSAMRSISSAPIEPPEPCPGPAGPAVAGSVILPFRSGNAKRPKRKDLVTQDFSPPHLDASTDEALIERARREPGPAGDACLAVLYKRYYAKVAAWCLRLQGGDRDEAADLAQEVFLRVHERLGSFRGESRFSTWLYTVTRSVVINRGVAARRRQAESLDEIDAPEPVEPAPGAQEELEKGEVLEAFRQAMDRDLEPLEAKVLYLHFVDGLPVKGITDLLGLENKSGAKAYLVSGNRKLKRRFGRWLASQSAGGTL